MKANSEKLIVALFVFLLSICVLTACSAGGEDLPADRNVLIYASFQPFGVEQDMELAIEVFNQTHTDVQIEAKDYWGNSFETAAQGREQLITEILTGRVPDIIDLGYTNTPVAMLPYRQLAQRGYLEDLWPYIENDPELGREAVLEAPLQAAEVDGGLYMLFDSVLISTLAGSEQVVGDQKSWTMEDLKAAFASMPEDSTILQYVWPRVQVAEHLLGMSMDGYIDWETGQCSFDSENFRFDLEFLKELPEEIEWTSNEAVNLELGDRMREGRQMLEQTYIRTPQDIQKFDALFGGRASFVGYPTADGSAGSAFYPAFTKLAISSTCGNKEAAWEFVRQLLLPQYSDLPAAAEAVVKDRNPYIPVNLVDYGLLKRVYTEMDSVKTTEWLYAGTTSIEYDRVSDADIDRFENLLNSVGRIELYDSELLQIVMDQAGPYFAGDKTVDETVALIQNRVTLYVNENK